MPRFLSRDKPLAAPTRRGFLIALGATAVAHRGYAAPADVPGWGAARWGMTREELSRVLGPALVHLAAPLVYGKLVVRDTLPGQRIAGRPFVALFQFATPEERLAQVLVQYPGRLPMLGDFHAVRTELAKQYGQPQDSEAETDYRGSFPSYWIEAAWRFPTTEVHLRYTDPNADVESGERKRFVIRYAPGPAAPFRG